MRHRVYGRYLGRNKDQREALFRNLVQALVTHGTIETSESKAKAIKGLVDKVINLAKVKKSQHLLQSFLTNKNLRERLVKEIVPKLGNRGSGYTSFMRLGPRLGDQTMMVRMSLIGAEKLGPIKEVIPRLRSGQASDKKPASPAKRGEQVTPLKDQGYTERSRSITSKKTEPIKKEVKVKEKTEKVVKKPTKAIKVNASRKGAKKS